MKPLPASKFIHSDIIPREGSRHTVFMDNNSRLDVRHWDMAFEHPSVRDHHYQNQGLKFMSIVTDRDSAIMQRNSAFPDKRNAHLEKEATMLQMEVGYTDRSNVISQRDAEASAVDYSRDGTNWINQRSILQGLPENPHFSSREYHNIRPISASFPPSFFESPPAGEAVSHAAYGKRDGNKESSSKVSHNFEPKMLSRPKKQKKQVNGGLMVVKKEQKSLDVVINGVVVDISTMPIPVCSCTGTPQQCYKWGNGGWQSACCTTTISMYPLPLNPKRRGARVAGRKMSGGAFKKLLERLATEGYNLNYPIDLKNYWAKHGTNKFVTIR
eukprot:TRINITY_DN4397_c0_g4_i1.p1 TRINITY_DN4397_c0_g4~~TRINITY_DN4397_c0_g4_i1.p1  ORF type:complete len:327 (-),score=54.51 TRINITY_DN4397_c0_g4_i1:447-1427(-)